MSRRRSAAWSGPAPWLAGLAVVGVVLGAAVMVVLARDGTGPEVSGAPVGGPLACPQTVTTTTRRPTGVRAGKLVPAGAVDALLCTFEPDSGGAGAVLSSTRRLARDPGDVVSYLNRLPDPDSAGGLTRACLLTSGPEHRIVVGYAGAEPLTVVVAPNCGTAEQGGGVRLLTDVRQLLEHWRPA